MDQTKISLGSIYRMIPHFGSLKSILKFRIIKEDHEKVY